MRSGFCNLKTGCLNLKGPVCEFPEAIAHTLGILRSLDVLLHVCLNAAHQEDGSVSLV
jgi:hypothetical protein